MTRTPLRVLHVNRPTPEGLRVLTARAMAAAGHVPVQTVPLAAANPRRGPAGRRTMAAPAGPRARAKVAAGGSR